MRKSLETFRFRYLKNYDIQEIKKVILELEKEWLLDTSRQDTFEVHKETVTFFLTDYDLLWKPNDTYAMSVRDATHDLWKLTLPIIRDLEEIHGGKAGRVIFPNLKAGGVIQPHVDAGDYLDVSRRNHIPIITNPKVFFGIEGGWLNMLEGECWEINNMLTHEVRNESDQDRVHLLIDIIPKEYLG